MKLRLQAGEVLARHVRGMLLSTCPRKLWGGKTWQQGDWGFRGDYPGCCGGKLGKTHSVARSAQSGTCRSDELWRVDVPDGMPWASWAGSWVPYGTRRLRKGTRVSVSPLLIFGKWEEWEFCGVEVRGSLPHQHCVESRIFMCWKECQEKCHVIKKFLLQTMTSIFLSNELRVITFNF